MSSSLAADVLQQVLGWIRNGLVGPHNHSAAQGGPIVSDMPLTVTNPLQPAIISRTQILNQNFNADFWRGHRIYGGTTAPTSKTAILNLGDFWFNGSQLWNWNGSKWVSYLTGILPVANGGTGTSTAFTAGSVVFAGASGVYSQDNANLSWDDTQQQLFVNSPGGAHPAFNAAVNANLTDTGTNFVFGAYGAIYSNNTGTRPLMVGGRFEAYSQNAAGTITEMAGFSGYCEIDAGTVVQCETALFEPPVIVGGTLTIAYGVLINDVSVVGASTRNWNLYSQGSASQNVFEGQVIGNAIIAQGTPSSPPALTSGSLGSALLPVSEGSVVSVFTDALAGNVDGCVGTLYDSTGALYKIGARLNGLWKHTALAGFSIPNYSGQVGTDGSVGVDETICPLCDKQMKPGQGLGMYADKWDNLKNSDSGLHAVAAHLKCLSKLAG